MRAYQSVGFPVLLAVLASLFASGASGSPFPEPGKHPQHKETAVHDQVSPFAAQAARFGAEGTAVATTANASVAESTPPVSPWEITGVTAGSPQLPAETPGIAVLPLPSSPAGAPLNGGGATPLPSQVDGIGQAEFGTLIARAMDALASLRQVTRQISAAPCPPSGSAVADIASIPIDNSGAQIQAGGGNVHNVTIGDGFTRFTPTIIKALPGDIVMFSWVGKNNHSVTESDALGSCVKSSSPEAFDSGVQPPGTVWNLTIPANAKGVKFFYCKVGVHCANNGMTGVIIT